MDILTWAESYRRAWEEGDDELVTSLFTEDATYRSLIFNEAHVGHAGISAYWQRVTATQTGVEVKTGRPFIDGDRVALEWWTQMTADGEEVTLVGCLLLHLAADGRCDSLREYWNLTPGRHQPPPEWGT